MEKGKGKEAIANALMVDSMSMHMHATYPHHPLYSSPQPHHHLPPASFYNAKGRAYPDVSAASSGFWVVSNLVPLPGVAGTSCAAPTFSGIIALLNDARLSAGKPTLGFLNPLIYSGAHASPLTDIVDGCNAGCSEAAGFCAVQGWDPVTGMGVPNYVAMQTAWV